MTTVIAGLAGGLLATILMTIGMKVVGDGGPPPTAALVAKFAGGEPADHAMPGMAMHLAYGIGAGVIFALGVPLLGFDLGSIAVATGFGLVYGLVLMVGGMIFWVRTIIGMEPDSDMMMAFGVAHVIYGVVLGSFIGAGILT